MSLSVLGILVSLVILMYFAYRGTTVLILAPIAALTAVLISSGGDAKLLANYTEVYMAGFASFMKVFFPLFLFGAIFGKLMDETGAAKSIAKFVGQKLGKDKAILCVVVICALLTYGGVSLFVVVFAVYPLAVSLFKEANVPKRLIPGAIGLGAFTFTMTALPGSPQIQNAIPMRFFGTDSFAAPVLGIIAAIIMFTLGMLWLNKRAKVARLAGEGYGSHKEEYLGEEEVIEIPNIFVAVLPIIVITLANLLISKVILPSLDTSYLESFNTSIAKVGGIWSLVLATILADIVIIIINWKKIKNLKESLKKGAMSSVLAIVNTCAEVGYGTVIKTLTGFGIIKASIVGISGNVLITEAISTNVLCGITASASGGLSIALTALGSTITDMAVANNISPEVLHRIASLAASGLDTLPHNGAVITLLGICGLTHRQSYKDVGVCTVLIPIVTTIIIVILAILGVQF
jgi:H+/gluconate symporter-like permease